MAKGYTILKDKIQRVVNLFVLITVSHILKRFKAGYDRKIKDIR